MCVTHFNLLKISLGEYTTTEDGNVFQPIKDLFAEEFLMQFLGNGELELKRSFKENSLVDWFPRAPIRLFHGSQDEEVNYNNSIIALDNLKANGADIDLITIDGGNHSSSVFESYSKALEWFNSFEE